MPATQISFAAFALSQQAAIDCTPPAQPLPSMDAGLVTQPSVGGGECAQIDLRRVHVERPSWVLIRADYRSDWLPDAWDGFGLDAPSFLPSGSAVVLGLEAGHPFVDGAVSRPGWYA